MTAATKQLKSKLTKALKECSLKDTHTYSWLFTRNTIPTESNDKQCISLENIFPAHTSGKACESIDSNIPKDSRNVKTIQKVAIYFIDGLMSFFLSYFSDKEDITGKTEASFHVFTVWLYIIRVLKKFLLPQFRHF